MELSLKRSDKPTNKPEQKDNFCGRGVYSTSTSTDAVGLAL